MAETKPRVMDLVRKELVKDPSISSEALYQKAKKVDRSIGSLSIRQFHARYPLQVKRISAAEKKRRGGAGRKRGAAKKAATPKSAGRKTRKSAARRGRPRKQAAGSSAQTARASAPSATPARSASGGDSRSSVRSILLEFAREVAAAEGKADIIGVVGRVDTWVDRVQKAAS